MSAPSRWSAAVVACLLVLGPALGAERQARSPEASRSGADSPRTLINTYCVTCHNDRTQSGGVSLQTIDFGSPARHGEVLEKVLRKVRNGEMPPAGRPRPEPAAVSRFTTALERSLDDYAAAHPNPGRESIHRLNRAEYSNAIRDLLALDIKPGDWLPVDDSGYGFDNIADVLSSSPALVERYLSAASRVSRLAVGDLALKPAVETFEPARDPLAGFVRRNDRVSEDMPFGSRGGLSIAYYFPLDAAYVIRVSPTRIGGSDRDQAIVEHRMPIKAGLHTLAVTFPKESTKPDGEPAAAQPTVQIGMDLRLDGRRVKLFDVPQRAQLTEINKITIGGPYDATGRGETPSRSRIFTCRPANANEELPCARSILTTLVRRGFRRPATAADVEPLLAFYERGRKEKDFDSGIQQALEAMLVSPEFLFRIKDDQASRLSFFLWSSIPDEELLNLAERDKLNDPAILPQQVRRLLADPRSQSLVANFAGQWLYFRNVATVKPDPDIFRFDAALREALQKETALFFESILREDRSVVDLLSADYTFVNERLAQHYGIPNVHGPQFRRVTITDPNRRGLLGQASVLTVTSYPNRTSVVQRGKWVLENLLGMPPPPPPANVPSLTPHAPDGKALSMREQMDLHRANAVCAACHMKMDPLGFALENYDGIGKWRTEDAGSAIDASGKLPDGTEFTGPAGLNNLLLTRYREQFVTAVTEKLLIYALGRGLEYYDQPAVRTIVRDAARENYRLSALIAGVVRSVPFQMRKAADR